MDFRNFRGAAKRIDDLDLPRLGHLIGVGEDEIHAVLDAETNGHGFDALGRPRMLFEPHIFWRELPKGKRGEAQRLGLAYPKWRRNYPADSYPRLKQAMAIDATAALRAASWGLGQVMGFNHKLAGYDTVDEMVTAFMADEENHLKAMVEFIVSAGLDDELRRHDWRGFARGYNGPGFEKNGYDDKLAAAWRRWAKIPDTAWSPEEAAPVPVPSPAPRDRAGSAAPDLIASVSKAIGAAKGAAQGSIAGIGTPTAIAGTLKAFGWFPDLTPEQIIIGFGLVTLVVATATAAFFAFRRAYDAPANK
ncbi:N-acetylmuramidase family protein [Jiella avicenniae]|uniref:N-acetylmuramidase family protein n=1 Tax=Jiella avicenniae TaxID=2907202 RepID=A0A9X1NVS0_9HYPH|nr:N-acetylmuramidase family protein [Jiella avicenniae]MCE7026437.1 N-acetylmuramidase family protein [Jiella avicenniae]